MTNADRIRQMTDEELSEVVFNTCVCRIKSGDRLCKPFEYYNENGKCNK